MLHTDDLPIFAKKWCIVKYLIENCQNYFRNENFVISFDINIEINVLSQKQWWALNLGVEHVIHGINFVPRQNCCASQIMNIYILLNFIRYVCVLAHACMCVNSLCICAKRERKSTNITF